MLTLRLRRPGRPLGPVLIAAAALAGTTAPQAAAAAGTKTLDLRTTCTGASASVFGATSLSLSATVPDSVAPGQSFNVTVTGGVAYRAGVTPFPGTPSAGSQTGIAKLSLTTDGATAASAPQRGDAVFGPSDAPYPSWWSGQLASGPSVTFGPIVAGPTGAPVILRFGGGTVKTTYTPFNGDPATSAEAACAAGAAPLVVIPSTGVVPGAPVIKSISPDLGPVEGGTTVTLRGDNLASAFDTSLGLRSQLKVIDDHTLTVVTKDFSSVTGSFGYGVRAAVTTDFGTWSSVDNDTFIAYRVSPPTVRPKAPRITSVSTPTVTFGQRLTVTGTNLSGVGVVGLRGGGELYENSERDDTMRSFLVPRFSEQPGPYEFYGGERNWNLEISPTSATVRYSQAPVVDGKPAPGTPAPRLAGYRNRSTYIDWPKPTSSALVTGYEIYVDGELFRAFLNGEGGFRGSETLELPIDAGAHTLSLRARDEDGRASAISPPIALQVPVEITSLAEVTPLITPSATAAEVSYGGGYSADLFLNGTFVKSTEASPARLTGLSPNTTYTLSFVSRDAQGNVSSLTSQNFTTLPAPVQLPVVGRIAGGARAGVGGLLLVSGARLGGLRSVTIGGVKATALPFANQLLVLAPRLRTGRYPLVVTTGAGSSAVSDRTYVTYAP